MKSVGPAILDMTLIEITMGLLDHVSLTMGVMAPKSISKDGLHEAQRRASTTNTQATTSKALGQSALIWSISLMASASRTAVTFPHNTYIRAPLP